MSVKIGRTYDDFAIGDKIVASGITVTEAHLTTFVGLVGDFDAVHVNEEFAKTTLFKTRIVPGHLTASMVDGMMSLLIREATIALLGVSYRFRAPVKPGDTIHAEAEVIEKRPSKKHPEAGIVKFKINCVNQKRETVADGEYTVLSLKERAK